MTTPQKTSDITLGTLKSNLMIPCRSLSWFFVDLVFLGTFDRTLTLRKSNRKAIVVQCIGYTIVFLLVVRTEWNHTNGRHFKNQYSKKYYRDWRPITEKSKYKNTGPLEDELSSMMESVDPECSCCIRCRKCKLAWFECANALVDEDEDENVVTPSPTRFCWLKDPFQ
ncbi:MAG: hypothetical protein EXX96DRAFT_543132 [Benjaminiella poitrasii]|nr:MAG: hypothetical protein EXX96DRAFT_543132 [Benjaminiella poitrasii]